MEHKITFNDIDALVLLKGLNLIISEEGDKDYLAAMNLHKKILETVKNDKENFWREECACYANGHEVFHIVGNVTAKKVADAIIMANIDFAADGKLTPLGAEFSTAKEDIWEVAEKLSKLLPECQIFGQDSWDTESAIVCFKNGERSKDFKAKIVTYEMVEDDYFETCIEIIAENGYTFYAGGGMVYHTEAEDLISFAKMYK